LARRTVNRTVWTQPAIEHWAGHGGDDSSGDRPVRSLSHGEAGEPVLRLESAECLQRQADAGLVKAGNSQLRTVLVEAAHRLMRYDEKWGKCAARLLLRGKPPGVVTAAIANRWVRWLFHQMQPASLAA
jgi:hypothetical protein